MSVKMATATLGFRWLDVLEKEFDKAFVDLDLLLGDIDADQCEITYDGRQRMTTLSTSFAQLSHKAQTIFQNNAKLEAQLLDLRSQLCEVQGNKAVLQKELENLILQLHSAKLEVLGQNVDSVGIQKKLEQEMEKYRQEILPQARLDAELQELHRENEQLKQQIFNLQSEVFGARLAAKYLDKELAGRIQQIQLLGRDMKGNEHDKLWNQLEAEIYLHRHKTIIRACRGRSSPAKTALPPGHDYHSLRKRQGIGTVRLVQLQKENGDGLGMSITGGKEHGVPILISEIYEGTLADRCGALFVGDAILAVNGVDLRDAKHQDAVNVLSQQQGQITLEVVYVHPGEDSDDESKDSTNDGLGRYKLCSDEVVNRGLKENQSIVSTDESSVDCPSERLTNQCKK
uniref:Golgi-associated PDZ and coiled-coil motif-containing protein n=1 Tax=Strigamia maritima TaxID=126957 RepID=T1IY45_STRMM